MRIKRQVTLKPKIVEKPAELNDKTQISGETWSEIKLKCNVLDPNFMSTSTWVSLLFQLIQLICIGALFDEEGKGYGP